MAAAEVLALVRRRVRAQQELVREVVGVALGPARVLRRDVEVVEALRRGHDGVLAVEELEVRVQRRENGRR